MSWGYVTLVTMDKKHTRSFLNEVLSYKDEIEFLRNYYGRVRVVLGSLYFLGDDLTVSS